MNLSGHLLIDAGNSRLKWATAGAHGEIRPEGEMATPEATLDRIGALAKEFSSHYVIMSSVVPEICPLFARAFAERLHVVTIDSPGLGLIFDYPKPAEIGTDRLAAAIAAREDGQCPAIIVQCGTAVAYSVLDAQGRFCGGVIAPGLHAQLKSLITAAAQLPAIDLGGPLHSPARSTEEAIRSGVLLNFQGGAKEIIQRLIKEMPVSPPPSILLTGGDASYLSEAFDFPHTLRPLLVFEGLRIIGTRVFTELLSREE